MSKINAIPEFEAISGRNWLGKDGDAYVSWGFEPLGEVQQGAPASDDFPAILSSVPGFSAGFSFHNGRDTIVQSWRGTNTDNLEEAREQLSAVLGQLLMLGAEMDDVLACRRNFPEG